MPVFLIGCIQELQEQDDFVAWQLLCLPFPLAVFVAPLIGCLWMSTQSYGIAKLHLIFTSMSCLNLTLNVLLRFSRLGTSQSMITTAIQGFDVAVKGCMIVVGKRILSVNVKLNKLNQAKHIG